MSAATESGIRLSGHTLDKATKAKVTLENYYSNLIAQHIERKQRYSTLTRIRIFIDFLGVLNMIYLWILWLEYNIIYSVFGCQRFLWIIIYVFHMCTEFHLSQFYIYLYNMLIWTRYNNTMYNIILICNKFKNIFKSYLNHVKL